MKAITLLITLGVVICWIYLVLRFSKLVYLAIQKFFERIIDEHDAKLRKGGNSSNEQ